MLGRSDPLVGDALQTIVDRGDFIASLPDEATGGPAGGAPASIEADPAIVRALIERSQVSLAALKRDIATKSGSALFDFIRADLPELQRLLFDPQSHQVIMAGVETPGRARRRARSARYHRGLPRQVRHALRRRDRHHAA